MLKIECFPNYTKRFSFFLHNFFFFQKYYFLKNQYFSKYNNISVQVIGIQWNSGPNCKWLCVLR